jgi:acyl-CoA thioesterase FadM
VLIRVSEITRRTIAYKCTIEQGEQRIATGSMKIACVSTRTGEAPRSIEIPEEIAGRFR